MEVKEQPVRVTLDHCVIHVSDWDRSNAFYHRVLGAELIERPKGFAYRFGAQQLNLHGPGFVPAEVARLPVHPRLSRQDLGRIAENLTAILARLSPKRPRLARMA